MIKRFLVFIILTGLFGCILPQNVPSPTLIPSVGIPLPTTSRIESPGTTIEPGSTEIVMATQNVSTQPAAEATEAPQVLSTPFIFYRYVLQSGSPKPIMNFAHPEAACEWMGVGGQIFDLAGNPTSNVLVKLTGSLNGETLEMIALSGGAIYLGPGGYEFKVSDRPIESSGALSLTLYDDQGNATSDPLTVSTYASCDQNFILVNFVQVMVLENGFKSFLPVLDSNHNP